MEVNVDALEQMDLVDICDQEALDVFLNSGGEDDTVLPPASGRATRLHTPSHTSFHDFPPHGEPHRAVRLHTACTALLVPLTCSTRTLASQKWTNENTGCCGREFLKDSQCFTQIPSVNRELS